MDEKSKGPINQLGIPPELQKKYTDAVPGKLNLLQELLDKVKKNANNEELKQLRMEVHKMAGSAGTYGYIEASNLCKDFEHDLVEILNNPKSWDVSWSQKSDTYLDRIRKAFSK